MIRFILVLDILVIALLFAACNDGGSAEAEKTAADSAAVVAPADSAAIAPPAVDSIKIPSTVDSAAGKNGSNTGDPTGKKFTRVVTSKAEPDTTKGGK